MQLTLDCFLLTGSQLIYN